jgi:hypothetical protein
MPSGQNRPEIDSSVRTSIFASLDFSASDILSASFTGILPAASNRSVAALQLRAYASSFVSGSGACVRA